ncbi:MAG: DNA recombination protein RmuC, partial [Allosphingosinicella sp.]
MDPIVAVVLAIITLLLGLALGWFVGRSRGSALADERGRAAEQLRSALAEVSGQRDDGVRELATLQADARNFEARLKELLEAKEVLSAQFHEVGTKLLGEAQKQFLERADSRFNQASEKSEAQLKALLQPVEATLKRYEEGLTKVEKERVGSYEALREAVTLLHAGHSQVRDETARLVNALRSSPKARGRWGEQSLKNVLEQAGLSPYADFQMEVSVDTADGRLRPDVIVRLPGGRKLIIDAKCSLNAFLDASEEADEA